MENYRFQSAPLTYLKLNVCGKERNHGSMEPPTSQSQHNYQSWKRCTCDV